VFCAGLAKLLAIAKGRDQKPLCPAFLRFSLMGGEIVLSE
jgi:hypothetical protein